MPHFGAPTVWTHRKATLPKSDGVIPGIGEKFAADSTTEARHALYQVAQQALDNADAHAQASRVTILLNSQSLGGSTELQVRCPAFASEIAN